MSLEELIKANTAALEANTAALLGASGGKGAAEASTGKGRGRPAGSTNKAKNEPDEGLDEGLDEGDGLDGDGLGDDEPAYTFDQIKDALLVIRDHGGDKKGAPDVRAILDKFGLKTAVEIKDLDQSKVNEVAAHVKQVAAKKKAKVSL